MKTRRANTSMGEPKTNLGQENKPDGTPGRAEAVDWQLRLSPAEFARWQWGLVAGLLVLGTGAYVFKAITGYGNLLGVLRLLDVGQEASLPSWFSTFNLLLAAALAALLWCLPKAGAEGRGGWAATAALLLFMSLDEGAAIHEILNEVQRALAERGLSPDWFGTHAWLVLGAPLALMVGAMFVPFLWRMPRYLAARLILAGSVFLGGAVGLEGAGALMESAGISRDSLIYDLRRIGEEGLEMAGVVVLNLTLYAELSRRAGRLSWQMR